MNKIPCIVCGKSVSLFRPPGTDWNVSIETVDTFSFENGAAASISFGYGCPHDGKRFFIAICENCTWLAEIDGRLLPA
jgi:hypothetical protein